VAAQAAAHAAKEMIVVKRIAVLLVVLACLMGSVQQASAGGLLEFLFGSAPKIVQFFSPTVAGALSARDPRTLDEVTFDLDGTGNRVVLDSGIPVEKGLVLIGIIAPSTGDREVGEVKFRLDGDPKALEVISGPKPGEDQERWLRFVVSRARYMYGRDREFRGFQTNTAPYVFVVDTSLMLCTAHSVDIFVRQAGRGGLGASTLLPFRVVQLSDEDGRPVESEYQQPLRTTYPQAAPTRCEATFAPSYPISSGTDACPQSWEQYIIGAARRFGYGIQPADLLVYNQFGWTGAGTAPFVFFAVDGFGQLVRPDSFELRVNTRRVRYDESPADGLLIVCDLPAGAEVTPYMDGRPVRAWGRDLTINTGQYGHWVPAVRRGNQWTVDVR
jgi:hypothetical protein